MRRLAVATLALAALLGTSTTARADGRWRLDAGMTFSRLEQQVKSELGGPRGERLVVDMEVGFQQTLTYRVWGPFSLGHFIQLDFGERSVGRFGGFDEEGKTVAGEQIGGSYLELWSGPLLRAEWRRIFIELGYGAIGRRFDAARDDLPAEGGGATGLFRTSPTVAWMFGLGGSVPITENLELGLRLQYRIRYYDRRGDRPLAGSVVHGTQNFTPFVGVVYRFGR